MDLFNADPLTRIIDIDGEVNYYGPVMPHLAASNYFSRLHRNIAWQHDEAVMFGRRIITRRMVAWYGSTGFSYTYSGTTKTALNWTPELLELKKLAESLSGDTYNSCLLNLYQTGNEGMAWHSDDERSLAGDSSIASLSFGAVRKFALKHKVSKETHSLFLENGSLLVMKGATQRNWVHALPKTTRVNSPRVNLTFRTMAG